MDGFKISSTDEELELIENNAGVFKLLVDDEKLEIIESFVHAGRTILCQPHEAKDAINVYLILTGRLYHINSRKYVEAGSRIEFKNISESQHLSVLEDTKLIMIRTLVKFKEQFRMTNEIYKMIHLIQGKDHYTEDHCNDVGNLASQLAVYLKYDESVVENVLFSGKVHDLGKVEIDEKILLKPSSLDKYEFDSIMKHPQFGYNLLLEKTGDKDLSDILYQHHERMDGSGYPEGLKGHEIRIEAQIIAVVDSYSAMTTDRPYRKAMSHEAAVEELIKGKVTLYNPELVDGFIELMDILRGV